MKVMTGQNWHDTDVVCVLFDCDDNVREIVLMEGNEGSLLISKDDVVALAKEFGFVVYPKDANL